MESSERAGLVSELAASAAAAIDGIAGLVEDLSVDMRRQWMYMTSIPDGDFFRPVVNFVRSVDWTEPWLVTLMMFHIGFATVAVRSRDNSNLQMSLFTVGLLSVYFAETFNSILGKNWSMFSRKPYFDRDGVFVSTIWSAPILLIATLILINSLRTLTKLLIKWKKAELKHRAYLAQKKLT